MRRGGRGCLDPHFVKAPRYSGIHPLIFWLVRSEKLSTIALLCARVWADGIGKA